MKRSALCYAVLILAGLVLAIGLRPQGKSGSGPAGDAKPAAANRADPDESLAQVVTNPNQADEPGSDEPAVDEASPPIARELKTIREVLKPLLATLGREAKIESADDSLAVTYLPQTYSVRRPTNKSGTDFYEPRDEVGPGKNGLIVRAHVESAGEIDQLVIPQTLRQPFWLEYIDITPIKGTDKQIFWSVGYNTGTDRQLLAKIRAAMRSRGALLSDAALR